MPVAADNAEIEARVAGDAAAKELILEFKAKKALAKRIIKAVQGALEDAIRKESELSGRPFEKELRDLDLLLENSMRSRRDSMGGPQGAMIGEIDGLDPNPGINSTEVLKDTITDGNPQDVMDLDTAPKRSLINHQLTPDEPNGTTSDGIANGTAAQSVDPVISTRREPPTPPLSSAGQSQTLSIGGIPWYMEPFDPSGTTIHEERWTGRELVRGMSEELSDMDEDELSGLVADDVADITQGDNQSALDAEKAAKREARKKAAARRKRNRGW